MSLGSGSQATAGSQVSIWDRHTARLAGRGACTVRQFDHRVQGFLDFERLAPAKQARLELELARRRDYWADEAASALGQIRILKFSGAILAVFGFWATLGAAWLATLMTLLILATFVARAVVLRRTSRFGPALTRSICPDCGYDLSGVSPAIDPVDLGNLPAGPLRCTECGVPWPLLPPPMPGGEFAPVRGSGPA
jgi:hypothetical protein